MQEEDRPKDITRTTFGLLLFVMTRIKFNAKVENTFRADSGGDGKEDC